MGSPQTENGYVKIANELIEAFAKIRISGECQQIINVLIRKTYGYNKKEDRISLSQFQVFTGLKRNAICRAINKLIKMNVVLKKETTIANTYLINKHYLNWKVVPKKRRGVSILSQGGLKNVNKVVPKKRHTKDIKTITKDSVNKSSPTHLALKHFTATYLKKFNKEYIPSYAKDNAIIKELLNHIKMEDLLGIINSFFDSKDKFVIDSNYGIPIFRSQVNKLQINNKPTKSFYPEFKSKPKENQ